MLATLAVVGLALAPATASASSPGWPAAVTVDAEAAASRQASEAAQGIAGVADSEAMEAMACCPPAGPATPDCRTGCPLAALCLAKVPTGIAASLGVPSPEAGGRPRVRRSAAAFRSAVRSPPAEPPRA